VNVNGEPDPHPLERLADYRMPFGKHRGAYVLDLPEAYLVWFKQRGWPKGRLGEMMALALEVKLNGLRHLVTPLRSPRGSRPPSPR